MWLYFWIFSFIPFICKSILTLIPQCFCYYCFVLNVEIKMCDSSIFLFFFFKIVLFMWISCKLVWILNSALNKCLQERLSRFGKDCIISFEYYWVLLGFWYYFHLKNTKLSNWCTWIYFHLFMSLIPLSKILFFSVQVLYIFG